MPKKNGGKVHPYTQHISGFTQHQRARVINILTLKEVLRLAGINQKVQGYKFSAKTHRKEWGFFPKYTVITAHYLRRSFATNFFGKIPTPILMQKTGHSKESTFMSYIGRDPNRDAYADAFMEGVLSLSR
ncbi:MAG: hypothetical protein ACPGVF_00020 [Flavobacteriaceae bacterium]